MEYIQQRAKKQFKHILFPETGDERVLKAAAWLMEQKICECTLIGNEAEIKQRANESGVSFEGGINTIDPEVYEDTGQFAKILFEKRKEKGLGREEAEKLIRNPLYFSGMMVATGRAGGCVAGSVSTTGEVIRAAIQTVGLREGNSLVSSIFLMELPGGKMVTYGDCGVVPYPDSGQLSEIAGESARTHKKLTKEEPYVAMLSFSTLGSAQHERVELVKKALEKARTSFPGLNIDGEFQFDTAFDEEVARRKAPRSEIAGKANVFIFPNLDAGNIAYKITERVGGAKATGPILQGLAKPMMDLSRGCDWKDIVNAACVAALME